MSSLRSRVLKDWLMHGGSQYLTNAILLAAGIFTARILGPENKGILTGLLLIPLYGGYVYSIAFLPLNRAIPLARGQGRDQAYLTRVMSTAFFYALGAVLLLSAGVLAYAVSESVGEKAVSMRTFGLYVMAGYVILDMLLRLIDQTLRAYDNFKLVSQRNLAVNGLEPLLVLAAAYYFGLPGVLVTIIVLKALVTLWLGYRWLFEKIRRQFDARILWDLSRIGLPMLGIVFGARILLSFDQVMIVSFLGAEPLGYYSIAFMASRLLRMTSVSLSNVMQPKIVRAFGETDDYAVLRRMIRLPSEVVSCIVSLLVGLAFILARPMVMLVLPEFEPGIPALQILILGIGFDAAASVSRSYFLAANRLILYLVILGSFCLINIAANGAAIFSPRFAGHRLAGVAGATALTQFLYAVVTVHVVEANMKDRPAARLGYMLRLFAPAVYAVGLCAAAHFVPYTFMTGWHGLPDAGIKSAIYLVLFSPFLLRGWRLFRRR